MGPLSYMLSVVDRKVVMRDIPVFLLRHSRAVSQSGETSVYPDGRTNKEVFTLRSRNCVNLKQKEKVARGTHEPMVLLLRGQ